jgi:hypothetical protein
MNKLLQRLPDSSREEVRNQAIVLIQQLTSSNEEMKKTVVFNEVHMRAPSMCLVLRIPYEVSCSGACYILSLPVVPINSSTHIIDTLCWFQVTYCSSH